MSRQTRRPEQRTVCTASSLATASALIKGFGVISAGAAITLVAHVLADTRPQLLLGLRCGRPEQAQPPPPGKLEHQHDDAA